MLMLKPLGWQFPSLHHAPLGQQALDGNSPLGTTAATIAQTFPVLQLALAASESPQTDESLNLNWSGEAAEHSTDSIQNPQDSPPEIITSVQNSASVQTQSAEGSFNSNLELPRTFELLHPQITRKPLGAETALGDREPLNLASSIDSTTDDQAFSESISSTEPTADTAKNSIDSIAETPLQRAIEPEVAEPEIVEPEIVEPEDEPGTIAPTPTSTLQQTNGSDIPPQAEQADSSLSNQTSTHSPQITDSLPDQSADSIQAAEFESSTNSTFTSDLSQPTQAPPQTEPQISTRLDQTATQTSANFDRTASFEENTLETTETDIYSIDRTTDLTDTDVTDSVQTKVFSTELEPDSIAAQPLSAPDSITEPVTPVSAEAEPATASSNSFLNEQPSSPNSQSIAPEETASAAITTLESASLAPSSTEQTNKVKTELGHRTELQQPSDDRSAAFSTAALDTDSGTKSGSNSTTNLTNNSTNDSTPNTVDPISQSIDRAPEIDTAVAPEAKIEPLQRSIESEQTQLDLASDLTTEASDSDLKSSNLPLEDQSDLNQIEPFSAKSSSDLFSSEVTEPAQNHLPRPQANSELPPQTESIESDTELNEIESVSPNQQLAEESELNVAESPQTSETIHRSAETTIAPEQTGSEITSQTNSLAALNQTEEFSPAQATAEKDVQDLTESPQSEAEAIHYSAEAIGDNSSLPENTVANNSPIQETDYSQPVAENPQTDFSGSKVDIGTTTPTNESLIQSGDRPSHTANSSEDVTADITTSITAETATSIISNQAATESTQQQSSEAPQIQAAIDQLTSNDIETINSESTPSQSISDRSSNFSQPLKPNGAEVASSQNTVDSSDAIAQPDHHSIPSSEKIENSEAVEETIPLNEAVPQLQADLISPDVTEVFAASDREESTKDVVSKSEASIVSEASTELNSQASSEIPQIQSRADINQVDRNEPEAANSEFSDSSSQSTPDHWSNISELLGQDSTEADPWQDTVDSLDAITQPPVQRFVEPAFELSDHFDRNGREIEETIAPNETPQPQADFVVPDEPISQTISASEPQLPEARSFTGKPTAKQPTDEQLDQLAEIIYSRLQPQLIVERERQGRFSSGYPPWLGSTVSVDRARTISNRQTSPKNSSTLNLDVDATPAQAALENLTTEIYTLLRHQVELNRERHTPFYF